MDFHTKKVGKQPRKARLYLISLLAVALLVFTSIEIIYQYYLHTPADAEGESNAFIIQNNETPRQIAERLATADLITSPWAFVRYADQKGFDVRLQAGRFYLPGGATIPQIAEALTDARPQEISVTIREGLTNAEIDAHLASLKLIDPGEFVQCVAACDFSAFPFLPAEAELREGFFFPDTYYVDPDNFNVEAFAQRLLRTFDDKTKAIFGQAERNGWEILKMASIVEKESRKSAERPIVAGILWKRYDAGQLIGADATTRYAVNKATEALTIEDLRDDNPWNTRAVVGLPPGAICNPGLDAIQAAANPTASEYWYYLHDPQGDIHYATTNDEHNANKARYL